MTVKYLNAVKTVRTLDFHMVSKWVRLHEKATVFVSKTVEVLWPHIKYIWNFANVSLQVPPDVVVQREVIAGGLAMLSVRRKMNNEKIADKE